MAAPSVKQHLASIRMLFDWLVTGQVVPTNPAHSVRGPRHSVGKGSTPVLSSEEATARLARMNSNTMVGLRETAIGCHTFRATGITDPCNITHPSSPVSAMSTGVSFSRNWRTRGIADRCASKWKTGATKARLSCAKSRSGRASGIYASSGRPLKPGSI